MTFTGDKFGFLDTARVPEKLDHAIIVSSDDELIAQVEYWLYRVVTGIDVRAILRGKPDSLDAPSQHTTLCGPQRISVSGGTIYVLIAWFQVVKQ